MKRVIGCLLVMLISAGCAQQTAAPPAQPTATPLSPTATRPTDTPAPTLTPVVRATLPPTWTFTPGGILTDTPTPTATFSLTPSATFTFTPSNTFTPTLDVTNEALRVQPTLAACAEFGVDAERTSPSFVVGSAPTVFWAAAEGATVYRVWLFDANLSTLFDDTTPDISYTFDADLFTFGQQYVFEVAPLDADGAPFCVKSGSLLLPVVG